MALGHAKSLRKTMTDAELRLWYRLRAHRFYGIKFKRQAPIGTYIVDFVCFEKQLIIEVDGGQHADDEVDRGRTRWLEDQGFRVLRFWNNEVLNNTSGVLESILDALGRLSRNPSPGSTSVEPPTPARGEGKKDK